MSLVIILTVVIFILILYMYSIGITFLYVREKSDRSSDIVEEDVDHKLKYIRSRLKKVRKETPSYIKINIKD